MNGNLSTLLINQNWFIDNISQKTNPITLNDWQFLIVTNEKNTSITSTDVGPSKKEQADITMETSSEIASKDYDDQL